MIGAGKNAPPGKYERWLSSASSGSVGLAIISDRLSPKFKSPAACLGELEVLVSRLELGWSANLSFAGSVVSALKLIKHVRDLVDRFWGVTIFGIRAVLSYEPEGSN
ncbi:hypothetical protein PIB30_042556 [Stylosanthes scabra]|uniref:Uncharacterized protein n=1 Tax=Stylosanthes scabra TaxID=79078 RepID=A0ABU6YE23_9FABA|nr:hypothetical protein [Stylosanthes scabra]